MVSSSRYASNTIMSLHTTTMVSSWVPSVILFRSTIGLVSRPLVSVWRLALVYQCQPIRSAQPLSNERAVTTLGDYGICRLRRDFALVVVGLERLTDKNREYR